MIKHIVLLKFKKDSSQQKIDAVFKAIEDLRKTIPEIQSFACGAYNSPEGLNRDYSHGFIMEFRNAAERDKYLVHPEHVRVASDIVMPAVTDGINSALAFDF